jgi:RHS repeat-associated protein
MHINWRLPHLSRILVGALACCVSLLGQTAKTAIDGSTPPALAPGQPAGSYALTGFETVSLFNGGLNFHLPLLSMKGRGSAGVSVGLSSQPQWVMELIPPGVSNSNTAYSALDARFTSFLGTTPNYSPGTLTWRAQGLNPVNCTNGTPHIYQQVLTRLTFTEPDGTQHEFVDAPTGGAYGTIQQTDPCPAQGINRGRVWVTRDGTFWTYIADADIYDSSSVDNISPGGGSVLTGNIYMKDGTHYRVVGGNVTDVHDRNGNYVSYTYGTSDISTGRVVSITDTAGRSVTIAYNQDASTSTTYDLYDLITYPSTSGTQSIKVHYCPMDFAGLVNASGSPLTCPHYAGTTSKTYYDLFGYQSSSASKYNPRLVSYIELPDSRRYEFTYDAYGEITKVKLPTGGSFQYQYGPGDPSGGDANGVIGLNSQGSTGLQIYRRVTQRSVYVDDSHLEGTTAYQTAYTQPGSGSPCPGTISGITWCTTVYATHQDASSKVLAAERHYFYGGANDASTYFFTAAYPKWTEGREYQTEYLRIDGQGTFDVRTAPVQKSESDVWEQRPTDPGEPGPQSAGGNNSGSSPIDVRVKQHTTNLVDSSQSSYEAYLFDRYNNATQKDEVGFDQSLARRTITQYLSSKTIGSTTWDYLHIPLAQGNAYGSFSGDYSKIVHIRNLPVQVSTYDSSGTKEVARTTFEYDNYTDNQPYTYHLTGGGFFLWDSNNTPAVRGNLTKQSGWLVANGVASSTVDLYRQYDNAGNVVSILDARGKTTSIDYECNSAFPYQVTNPLGQVVNSYHNCNTGRVTSFVGLNRGALETTTYTYGDILDRLTSVTFPDGGTTGFGYCDTGSTVLCPTNAPQNSVTKTVKQNSCGGTESIVTDSLYDGLGRTIQTDAYESGNKNIFVQTIYDGLGRTYKVSNPTRDTAVFTTTLYDALGRVNTVTAPDGSTTTSTWTGSTVQTSDPAGVTAKKTYDALGRLKTVVENPGGPQRQFTTGYTYDPLDDLLGVCHGADFDSSGNCSGRSRQFKYDSLKRLTSANNLESGLTCYGKINQGVCTPDYDPNGNLLSKTDARGWVTAYSYDDLNRVSFKTYSNVNPPDVYSVAANMVTYTWDSVWKGRLASVQSGISTTQYTDYDHMGRVKHSTQTTNGVAYDFDYTYNAEGGLETEMYPARVNGDANTRRTLTTCYDVAGRVKSVTGVAQTGAAPTHYTGNTDITYAPHGEIDTLNRGDGLVESWKYTNDRMLPASVKVGTTGAPTSVFGADIYYCAVRGALPETTTCTNNNGNLANGHLYPLNVDQNFGYDELNRLQLAYEGPQATPSWKQTYDHDAYGNHWVDAANSSGFPIASFTPTSAAFFNAKNQLQIQGSDYDAAGNQKVIGGYTFVWDSEGRMTKSSGPRDANYTYDGDGRRVMKQGSAGTTVYVYDAMGDLAMEFGEPTSSPCTTCYLSVDSLGSTRAMTDGSGNVLERYDYLPFGEDVFAGTANRTTALKYRNADDPEDMTKRFTGKERDADTASSAMPSGLDYFGARYFASVQGRFISPDEAFADQHHGDPQSWNLYSYAANNPTRYIDPNGRGVREGLSKGIDNVGISMITLATQPDRVVAGLYQKVAHPMQTLKAAASSVKDFWNSSFDAKVTTVTSMAVPAVLGGAAGAVGAGAGGATTTLGLTEGAATSEAAEAATAAAVDAADAAQAGGRTNGTAAGLRVGDQTFADVSSGGAARVNHPTVQQALDNVPNAVKSDFHGHCAEIGCLNQAAKAGVNPAGGTMRAVRIRAPGKAAHGTPKPPCTSCTHVMKQMGVGN